MLLGPFVLNFCLQIDDLWAEDVSGCHSVDYYDFIALAECSGISEANLINYAELMFEWKY